MNQLKSEGDGIARIIALLNEIGSINDVGADEDFYEAGFSSIASLQLLMDLETRWSISIPDDEFVQARTPRALHAIVERLVEAGA